MKRPRYTFSVVFVNILPGGVLEGVASDAVLHTKSIVNGRGMTTNLGMGGGGAGGCRIVYYFFSDIP